MPSPLWWRRWGSLVVGAVALGTAAGCYSPYRHAPYSPYSPSPYNQSPYSTYPAAPMGTPGMPGALPPSGTPTPAFPSSPTPYESYPPAGSTFGPPSSGQFGAPTPVNPGGGTHILPPSGGSSSGTGSYDGGGLVPNYGDPNDLAPPSNGNTFEGTTTPFYPDGASFQRNTPTATTPPSGPQLAVHETPMPTPGPENQAGSSGGNAFSSTAAAFSPDGASFQLDASASNSQAVTQSAPAAAPSTQVVTAAAGPPAFMADPEPFARDPEGFRWLRGVVDFDPVEKCWILFYSDQPAASDPFAGRITLAGNAMLSQLQDGAIVLVEGQVDEQHRDSRTGLPTYRVDRLQTLTRAQ